MISDILAENRPKHLQLQLDNCGRENKNTTVFQFCGYLVSVLKWFLTAQINFLLVGHSHDEVDRWHSESEPMKHMPSTTLETFIENYKKVKCFFKHQSTLTTLDLYKV
jgi:hypothetical protein